MRMRSSRIGKNSEPGICNYRWLGFVFGFVVLLGMSAAAADEDAYLRMIQSEASKVPPPGEEEASGSAVAAGAETEEFEKELERRYRGSYVFYKKLPEESQIEIFVEDEGAGFIPLTADLQFLHVIHEGKVCWMSGIRRIRSNTTAVECRCGSFGV